MIAQSRLRILSLLAVFVFSSVLPAGPPPRAGKDYPLVYGATGRAYGPTMAHYQYKLRYGRPWYGGRSSTFYSSRSRYTPVSSHYFAPYNFPVYYGLNTPVWTNPYAIHNGFFYPSFGAYGYLGYSPGVPTVNHVPFTNGLGAQTFVGQGFQPEPTTIVEDLVGPQPPRQVVGRASSNSDRERSLKYRLRGDEKFALTNYLGASENYEEAIKAAPDQADPRYRNAITLAARSRFDEAVEVFKTATQLDPFWVFEPASLDELFGPNNDREKQRIKTRVAEWTSRDVRDPNRLFLLGALMVLDHDDRAKQILELAVKISGDQDHLAAFLRPLQIEGVEQVSTENAEPIRPRVFEIPPNPPEPGLTQDNTNSPELLVPPVPFEPKNRGEITGEERARRVFEKSDPSPSEENTSLDGPLLPPLPE